MPVLVAAEDEVTRVVGGRDLGAVAALVREGQGAVGVENVFERAEATPERLLGLVVEVLTGEHQDRMVEERLADAVPLVVTQGAEIDVGDDRTQGRVDGFDYRPACRCGRRCGRHVTVPLERWRQRSATPVGRARAPDGGPPRFGRRFGRFRPVDLGFADRVAVVAGNGAAPRRACAQLLAAEGAEVLEADLAGGAAAATAALERHGRLDVVVALLDRSPVPMISDITDVEELLDVWDPVLDVVELYQVTAPAFRTGGWGRFVAVLSSTAKTVGEQGGDLDAIAGLGLLGFHKDVGWTLGPDGVTANAVLRTPEVSDDEVADVVAFLASEGAGYLSGITITVDAGTGRAVY